MAAPDRSGVGIFLPGRIGRTLLRKRAEPTAGPGRLLWQTPCPIRMVCPQFGWADPPSWRQETQCLRVTRHARKRMEWCLDAVKRNKTSYMSDRKTARPILFQEGEWRALRGGNFEVPYSRCRSAYRERMPRPFPIRTEGSDWHLPPFWGSKKTLPESPPTKTK